MLLGFALLVAIGAMVLPSFGWSRSRPSGPQVDQRVEIEARVSSDPAEVALRDAIQVNQQPETSEATVSPRSGWTHDGTAWKKTFGPFRRGDTFILRVIAGSDVFVRCALRTVGQPQRASAPRVVTNRNGHASCSIVAGD